MFISLTEYARRHGKAPATARQMALRGGFATARKVGRDWLIDEKEAYPDKRIKSGRYIGWRKSATCEGTSGASGARDIESG